MNAVEFHQVAKRFTVHHNPVGSFHASLIDRLRGTWTTESFWALRDVSFTVARGETLGIIGANGSGKSTALKLIAHILEPTSGQVVVNGSVASILELGAGFHPELSGQENIYLFGTFHGFSKKEIDRRYDGIVQFADLEDFIDQPIKHYSSGMYVRLAFAAAISVQADILLLDEIFAVGDERFQHKCTDAIARARRRGTSIVLVSHSLELVGAVCDRAIWMDAGKVTETGASRDVGSHYLVRAHQLDDQERASGVASGDRNGVQQGSQRTHAIEARPQATSRPGDVVVADSDRPDGQTGAQGTNGAVAPTRWGSGEVRITRVRFAHADGTDAASFATGEELAIELHYACRELVRRPVFGVAIYDARDVYVSGPNTHFSGEAISCVTGSGRVTMRVASLPLLAGTYKLSVAIYDEHLRHAYDHHERAYTFRVHASALGERYGLVHLGPAWEHVAGEVSTSG